MMSQTEDRSGHNPEWVKSLDDMTPEQCHAYLDSLMDIDLKICDTPGCPNVAIYRVNFHGCAHHTWCGLHRAMSASGIEQVIKAHGSIVCEKCTLSSFTLEATMQWFAI
jgi:hypothetical protein